MNISRSFAFLFGLSVIALITSAPRPLDLLPLAVGSVIFAIVIVLGLRAAAPFRRATPILESLGRREKLLPAYWVNLGLAILVGILMGAVLLTLLFSLISVEPRLSARLAGRADQPAWMPWVLAFEASILEEVLFRLFLMSGIVWLLTRLKRTDKDKPSSAIVWIALSVSALGFGLVHLPSWFLVVNPTPFLITGVLLLNGVGGLVLGQVYWRWGIEAAMLCHFAGDMMIQGIGPRLLGA